MKRFLVALTVVAFLLFPVNAMAVESVTQTLAENGTAGYVWTVTWVAAANGSLTATAMTSAILAKLKGLYIVKAVTNPGSTAPTDNYDITLVDADGVDLMGGNMLNRDEATSEAAIPFVGSTYWPNQIAAAPTFTLTGNSVDSATGVAKFFFAR